jgi:NAD(P)-dependent dehydrogenase (short-subunit alcohol dehydrogenase family)
MTTHNRAALVTGASSGIGLAIARMLGAQGYGVTMAARRPDKLQAAADALTAEGFDVLAVTANLGPKEQEQVIADVVAAHRARFGRLDVLVNNAGIGIGQPVGALTGKAIDLQLAVNLRLLPLFYQECLDMLKAAGAEHRNALVVNMSSISGKHGEAGLSVYSATKAAMIAFTQAMNRELKDAGIKSTAICPAWVDTPMTDFIKELVPAETMIQPEDIAELVKALLALSPGCLIPEIMVTPPGDLAALFR